MEIMNAEDAVLIQAWRAALLFNSLAAASTGLKELRQTAGAAPRETGSARSGAASGGQVGLMETARAGRLGGLLGSRPHHPGAHTHRVVFGLALAHGALSA